jgi:hypothetical protein
MALIQCPECKTEISDQASTCPKCGHPIKAITTKSGVSTLRRVIGAVILIVMAVLAYRFLHEVNKPLLPVECRYRRALLSNGYVEIFINKSPNVLGVLATFENPTFKTTKSFRLNLSPNIPVQIGHLQGWDFTAGDKITLIENHYQTAYYTVP